MQTGNENSTRRANREIISVSLPVGVYESLNDLCEYLHLNRSALISAAVAEYVAKMREVMLRGRV